MTVVQSEETGSSDLNSGEYGRSSDSPSAALLRSDRAHPPAETLKRARAEYILGHYDNVLRLLETMPQAMTEAAAQRSEGDGSGGTQWGRSAAPAWALWARAAARKGEPDVSARAAGHAVVMFEMMTENGAALSGEELSDYAISLYLANRFDEAAEMMRQAVAHDWATSELHLYQGIVEFRRGHPREALSALRGAEKIEGQDLQRLRLEMLTALLESLGPDQSGELVDAYLDLAGAHFRAGRYEEALASVDRALSIRPRDTHLQALKGIVLISLGRFDEALAALNQAIAVAPKNVYALTSKGEALRQLRRFDEAVAALDQAIALDPKNAYALDSKGAALSALGRFDEAVAALDQAIVLDPKNAWAPAHKGEALRRLGRLDEAVEALDQAIALHPENDWALARKGEALRQLGRFDEAVAILDHAIVVNSKNVYALASKGEALRDLRRFDEAVAALDQAIALDPENDWALARKGEALRQLGRFDEAVAMLDQAIAAEPTNAYALASKGEVLRQLGHFHEAVALLDQAIAMDPNFAWALASKGEALSNLGRFEETVAALDQAIAVDPNYTWALAHKGEALRQLRRFDEAVEALDQAIALDPKYTYALACKGEALRQSERLQEAENTLRRVLELDPQELFARTALAHALLEQDRDSEALEMLEQALRQNPDYHWALEGKAFALLRLDDVDQGLVVIQRRLELEPKTAWTIGIHGAMLLQIEQYTAAARQLERSANLEPDTAWVQILLSDCYRQLSIGMPPTEAGPLLEQALAAAQVAVGLEPEDLTWRRELAESLWSLGGERRAQAIVEYRWLLEAARAKENLGFYDAKSAGWAALRLAPCKAADTEALLSEAEQLVVEALTLKKDRPTSSETLEIRFNLALTILCSKRFGLALGEYDVALRLAREKQPGIRRGLVGRARTRLEKSLDEWPQIKDVSHVKRALESLQGEYACAYRLCHPNIVPMETAEPSD